MCRSFLPKILGPKSPKIRGRIPKQLSVDKMVRTFSIHMPSLVEIGLCMATRTKMRVFVFLYLSLCHAGCDLFWSHRAATMFGTLTEYSFAIY